MRLCINQPGKRVVLQSLPQSKLTEARGIHKGSYVHPSPQLLSFSSSPAGAGGSERKGAGSQVVSSIKAKSLMGNSVISLIGWSTDSQFREHFLSGQSGTEFCQVWDGSPGEVVCCGKETVGQTRLLFSQSPSLWCGLVKHTLSEITTQQLNKPLQGG